MPVDPLLVRRLADEAGYLPTALEKVAHLEDLLREIARHPEFGEHLALKGGTAINFVLLPEAPRLSVDIDLNYVGAIEREEMLAGRVRIEEFIDRVADAQGYAAKTRTTYGATTWQLRYSNLAGNIDLIKIDINWLLRVPIWPPERALFRTVFPGDPALVTVAAREEVTAGKVVALLDRVAPRDLFDVATLSQHGSIGEAERLTAATMLLGSFHAEDFRERLKRSHLAELGEREIRNALWPTLRRDMRPTLDQLSKSCESTLADLLAIGQRERQYLDDFYEGNHFDPLHLFEGLDANPQLPRHPMAAWRLRQRGNKGTSRS